MTMYELRRDNVKDFMDRFCSLNDAVLRRVELHFADSGTRTVIVNLLAQDQEANEGWSDLEIVIDEVLETALHEGKATCQVLSQGGHIAWLDDKVSCDFSPYTSEPAGVDDVRKSDFYVIGARCAWRVKQQE